MSIDMRVAFELDDLSLDDFEMTDYGLEVESLTTGHGMPDMGGSCSSCSSASTSCTN